MSINISFQPLSEARRIHSAAIVLDGHADTPQRILDESWSFTDPLGSGMLNLASARAGGLTGGFLALWAEPREWAGRFAERTFALLEAVERDLAAHPSELILALSPDDIRRAHADGKFCVLLGIEGGHSIEQSLDVLHQFHTRGVRYMTLTWSNSTAWAGSSGDDGNNRGLTDFGRSVVREMNALGMMVDISHVSEATFWDVLQTTHAPVVASHSSARALTDSPRNLSDEQLRAIATANGLVMANFYPSFIDDHWRDVWMSTLPHRERLYAAAAQPFRDSGRPVPYAIPLAVNRQFYADHLAPTLPRTPLSKLVDHIDYIAQIAGIDHVGLGSDFDGFAILPEGMESAADLPNITAALLARGYTEPQLHKLLGGNLLRVMTDVQAATTLALHPPSSS